jgi:dienelactone hydrolase
VFAVFFLLALAPATAYGFDPAAELTNFAKIEERNQHEVLTPEFQQRLLQQNLADAVEYPQMLLNDPERNPNANVCAHRFNECAGDVRFYDFGKDSCTDSGPCGIATPVLFEDRSGATLSGTVWATADGPAQRPGIVITTGSVQAPETLYWGIAATLAKHGYVVLTYDVHGQGQSDTFGQAPDQGESVPAQSGRPFFDNTEDALDFLLSSPASPYVPRNSCTSGTSHAAWHDQRVADGFNTAFNPLHSLVDSSRIGIAGHSFGAQGVSFVGQKDPRVDAVVAWDNLQASTEGGGTAATSQTCPSDPDSRTAVPLTKPALGMSADYFLVPQPYTSDPDPQSKNSGFIAYKGAGVDSMQVNIRGGTHYEFSFLPGNTVNYPFGTATLRGMHMTNWYTAAWFDRYVKGGDATAQDRLLTDRWRDDAIGESVDSSSTPDGNLYSFYFPSRYDLDNSGTEAVCDDVRSAEGCASLAPDGLPADYSYLAEALTPDTGTAPSTDTDGDGVADALDSCPTVDGFETNRGCPIQATRSFGKGKTGKKKCKRKAKQKKAGAAKKKKCKRKRKRKRAS